MHGLDWGQHCLHYDAGGLLVLGKPLKNQRAEDGGKHIDLTLESHGKLCRVSAQQRSTGKLGWKDDINTTMWVR